MTHAAEGAAREEHEREADARRRLEHIGQSHTQTGAPPRTRRWPRRRWIATAVSTTSPTPAPIRTVLARAADRSGN